MAQNPNYARFVPTITDIKCSCGSQALFYNAAKKRYCCSSTVRDCPEYRRGQSLKTLAHADTTFGPPDVRRERYKAKQANNQRDRVERQRDAQPPPDQLCFYGCGGTAKFHLVNRATSAWVWCCSRRYQQCPAARAQAQEKMKATALERHGMEHHMQDPQVLDQRRATCQQRYGVATTLQVPEIRSRIAATNMERYGNVGGMSPETMAKREVTVRSRFGVSNVFQSPEIRAHIMQHWMDHYGVAYPAQIPENAEKRSAAAIQAHPKQIMTLLQRYGVDAALLIPGVMDKVRATSIKHFGHPHHLQSPAHFRKHFASLRGRKDFTLPSGRVVQLQGYEPYALTRLMEHHAEDAFNWLPPSIPYIFESKQRAYHPDFFLPGENLIIEVKSWYTLMSDALMNAVKQTACLAAGYRFEFWVGDDKDPENRPFTVITMPLAIYLQDRAAAILNPTV